MSEYAAYEPTEKSWATVKNAFSYAWKNKRLVWKLILFYGPFLLLALLLNAVAQVTSMEQYAHWAFFGLIAALGDFILSIFVPIFVAVTWHRVVINGPEETKFSNPLAPKKRDWKFLGFWLLIGFIALVFMSLLIGGASFLAVKLYAIVPAVSLLAVLLGIALFVYSVYAATRVSFIFPSVATDHNYPIKTIWKMSKGLVMKLWGAGFLSMLVMIPLTILFVAFPAIIAFLISAVAGGKAMFAILGVFVLAPIFIFMQVFFSVIGITLLSNYFMVAKQRLNA